VITYDAVIEVGNPDLKLFPGMTANVTILTQRAENVLKVPNAALRFRPPDSLIEGAIAASKPQAGNSATVYIATSESKVKAVSVKLGITDGNFTEVEGGLSANQQVIVGITTSKPASAPAPAGPSIPRRF
jgi:HlyD family secretion protein